MPRCPSCHRRLAVGVACPADGDRPAQAGARPAASAAPSLAGYQLDELLGVGGFATTWAGRRDTDGRAVAVKLSRRATRAARLRSEHEAAVLARLPAGVGPALLDTGDLGGAPYLVLERLPGRSLAAALADAPGPLAPGRVQALGSALLTQLAALHAVGLCHGDLKPDNIVCDGDHLRLVDFGLARGAGLSGAPAHLAGTPEYLAPELLGGAPASAASDLYAAGALLYELCTLRLPFVGEVASLEYGHSTLRPPPPSLYAEVAPELEALILACLAKDPARRPSAAAAAGALARSSGATAATAAPALEALVTRQPLVLVAADLGLPVPALAELAAGSGAYLLAARRGTAVFGVTGDARDPLGTGRALAAALVEQGGARVAVHVAPAQVAAAPGAPLVASPAIDDVDSWRSAAPADTVHETAALAGLDPAAPELPLVGRDQLVAQVEAAARACFQSERPTAIAITGAPGTGKTRLAAAIADRLAALDPAPRLWCERAPAVDATEGGELVRDAAATAPVAVIVDDAHEAAAAFLDALEYATLAAEPAPILVVCLAAPQFRHHRPGFGQRAAAQQQLELGPLAADDAAALLAAALSPCEYPPEAALRELVAWAGGTPAELVAVARALVDAGAVRERPGGGSYLATAELAALSRAPLWAWVAERELAALPPELAELVRACALLSPGFGAAELDAAVAAAEREHGCAHADTEVGLFQLRARGVLVADGGEHRFGRPALGAAIAAALAGERSALVHQVALERARADPSARALEAVAHHAAALGLGAEAAAARARLGEQAHRCHRPVEAERHFSAALAALEPGTHPVLAARCLLGRGRARYRIDRVRDAIADLRAAAALGSDRQRAEALLEEATALDWAQDHSASAARADSAAPLVAAAEDPVLDARLALARGRSAFRREAIAEALELLYAAAEAGAAAGDHDTRVIANLLLGPALVRAGQLDEAERCFDTVIELCEPAGDRLHLCALYGNRMALWSAREDPERSRADLREAMRLARQIGHPGPERVATYNLAEDLYWSGEDDDEALELAARARELARRFIDAPVAEDALLLARVALACGDRERAAAELSWVRASVPALAPSAVLFARMLDLALAGAGDPAWRQLCAEAEPVLGGDDFLELLYWWARSAAAAGRLDAAQAACQRAAATLARYPLWRRRFDELRASSQSA